MRRSHASILIAMFVGAGSFTACSGEDSSAGSGAGGGLAVGAGGAPTGGPTVATGGAAGISTTRGDSGVFEGGTGGQVDAAQTATDGAGDVVHADAPIDAAADGSAAADRSGPFDAAPTPPDGARHPIWTGTWSMAPQNCGGTFAQR